MRRLRSLSHLALVGATIALGGASRAIAADGTATPPDKSIYGVLNPTPDAELRAFSPDRPARASSPVTVDAGRFQVESDFANVTTTDRAGATTRTVEAADPVVKLGITSFTDVEVAFAGFVDTATTLNRTGETTSAGRGFGDVTLLTKFNVVGNEGGDYAFALIPYLRVPSGVRNVSDGQVEGGLIAPLTLALPSDFAMTLQTEFDALRDANGPGTHVNFTNIVNVSHEVPGVKGLTATAEVYSSISSERRGADVYTFDAALAYLVEPNTQLDLGTNVGLNRDAPDLQVYAGIAHRF